MVNRKLVYQYFHERNSQENNEAASIANTMFHLYREYMSLTVEQIYLLACRCWKIRRHSEDTFLYFETNDALRHILEYGLDNYGNCDVPVDLAYNFLMTCSDDLFDYILTREGVENRVRYSVEWPTKFSDMELSEEMKKVLEQLNSSKNC